MKKWTVYQVTNRVNGRRYIGVHKTEDPKDSYMGSGKLIKYALEKHGIENFSKEVLLITEVKAEAYKLEASLVTKDALESGELYNLKEGGEGGWDFANKVKTPDQKFKASSAAGRTPSKIRHLRSAERRKELILAGLSPKIIPPTWEVGTRNHSEETKRKMSESAKITSAGERNSQFGTRWITNGAKNVKIKKQDPVPEGWRLGRILVQ